MNTTTLLTAVIAAALVVPLAGQKGKPGNGPKPSDSVECTMQGDIQTAPGPTVWVGRDTVTYGPTSQELYIHESLLPPGDGVDPTGIALLKSAGHDESTGLYGPYYGQIRVLDNRIDYWFDTAPGCAEAITSSLPCRFRAVVVDGVAIYEKIGKTRVLTRIAFNDGRYLLDYRWCDPATYPDCYVKLYGCYDDRDCPGVPPGGEGYVYATLNVWF